MSDSTAGHAREDQLLLATKLYVPRARPTLLSRPRLLIRLEGGLQGPVTLISAPTGSGKTVLLTDWMDQRATHPPEHRENDGQRDLAWLSLDRGDDDLVQFLRYLVAACQTIVPTAGTVLLSVLHGGTTQLPPVGTLMTPLINDLARGGAASILVLDDYHVVSDTRIHDAVTFLLDHLPPQLHVVITSRTDPPLPLARWRAHGMLNELRAADLRFTAEEAAAFLTEVMRLPLATRDVEALEQRTEGWIAGLQFAALAMRDRADLASFVRAFTGSHRFVLDFLADEVLLREPPHRRTFLLRTSILDRMCGALCDAVLAEQTPESSAASGGDTAGASQAVLEELEQANLFIVPLDDARHWYRYHHLFADVLRHRLQAAESPDEVRSLHVRAAAWFEQQGLIAEAMQHSLEAADFEQYAHLVEQVGLHHMSRGEFGVLQRSLVHLPPELVRTRPRLSLIAGWALSFTADLQTVVARLDDTERLLAGAAASGEARALRDQMDGELLALRGFVAFRRQQIAEAITLMEQAHPRIPAANVHMRGMNLHHLGLAHHLSHDHVAASRAFAEAVSIFSDTMETRSYAVYPLRNLGMIEEAQGRLRRAEQTYRRALEHAVVDDQPLPSAGHAYLCLGRLSYERDDLPTAAAYLRQAIELGRQGELNQVIAEASIELLPVVQAQDAFDEVDALLQQAQEAARRWNDAGLVARAAAAGARIRLIAGRMAAASEWADEARVDLDEIVKVELMHLTYGRLLLAQRRLDDAQEFLERLAAQAENSGQLRAALEALALLALTQHEMGDAGKPLATLEHALRLAEPEGYIRTFLDAGPAMPTVLEAGLGRSDWGGAYGAPDAVRRYARTLLQHVPPRPAPPAPSTPSPAPLPPDVEPLTPRECDVLRLIAAGKSNGEIAAALVVAVSTVKAHINSIFGKLGATSRTQALVRARELQLL